MKRVLSWPDPQQQWILLIFCLSVWIGQFGVTLHGFTLLLFDYTHMHNVPFSTPLPPSHFPLIDGCHLLPLIQPLWQLLDAFNGSSEDNQLHLSFLLLLQTSSLQWVS